MADQWYYQLFGQEFGPVEFDDMAQMVSGGELGADDMVRRGADGAWVVANSVSELNQLATAVAVKTAEVADDIDSFMLVDEKTTRQPELAMDIDSFNLVDEQKVPPAELETDLATEIESFRLVDEQTARPPGSSTDLADEMAADLDSFQLVDEQRLPKSAPHPQRQTASRPPEEAEAREDVNAAIWYFQGLDTELGPVPRSELVAMVRRSELGPKDLIRKGRKGRWLPSELLTGLFEEAAAPPVMPTSVPPTFAPAVSAPDTGEVIWYCYVNDQEYGPMSLADLQASAAQGSIMPQSYVKYGAQGEWVLASTMPNLFPPPAPAVPPPVVTQPATSPADSAGAERDELVQQLLALVKQGLSAEMLGGAQPVAPVVGLGWYCNISGSVIGPVSIESLVQMVLQKRLFPDDMIRMGTTGEWFPAKTVPDLFPTSGPQGKTKKAGLDSGESVMERIDRMYREGQEAQAKADALKPKNEPVKAAASGESSRAAAGNVLRNVNANIARGTTTVSKSSSSGSLGEQFSDLFGGLKLDAKTIGVLVVLVLIGVGYYFGPMVMGGFATRSAFSKLVAIQKELKDATKGAQPQSLPPAKSKEMLKSVAEISKSLKGGSTVTGKREVSRMASALKDMIESVGKPPPPGAEPGAQSDFQRASNSFDTYRKTAGKKLGLK